MNAAVIKVKFADPAKAGKKQATIKTEDGQIFGVWPDKFGLLRPGQTYTIEFSEREYQGKTFRTITKCEPAAAVEESTAGLAQSSQRSSQMTAEQEFVARVLSASIQACATEFTVAGLTKTVDILKAVYRSSVA